MSVELCREHLYPEYEDGFCRRLKDHAGDHEVWGVRDYRAVEKLSRPVEEREVLWIDQEGWIDWLVDNERREKQYVGPSKMPYLTPSQCQSP